MINFIKSIFKKKRHIIAISGVPAGQYRSIMQIDNTDQPQGMGNACGLFALMSDDTLEIFSTDNLKWTKIPAIPERD